MSATIPLKTGKGANTAAARMRNVSLKIPSQTRFTPAGPPSHQGHAQAEVDKQRVTVPTPHTMTSVLLVLVKLPSPCLYKLVNRDQDNS
jgi:hypothetical protein